ncbi:MAG: Na+/H+ antiporter subunit E [Zestosphaera sp.]
MKRMFNKIIIMITSFILYTMFTGILTELTIVAGLAISLIIAVAFDGIIIKRKLFPRDVGRLIYVFEYLYHFIAVEITDHLKIAKVILSRSISVNPDIVEVPLELNSDYGVSIVALTITNTPGTIAVDFDKDRSTLYVHWLTAKHGSVEEIKKEIIGEFEMLAKKIFE